MAINILGIDIGKHCINVVRYKKTLKGGTINGYGRVFFSEDDSVETCVQKTLSIIEERGLESDRVVLGFSGERVYLKRLTFPFSNEEKIARILPYELESYLPVSMDDLVVDFILSSKRDKDKQDIYAAAMPSKEIEPWLNAFQEQGLDPWVIDLDISGLGAVAQLLALQMPTDFAIWDLGWQRSTLVFFSGNRIAAARSFLFGLDELAGYLAQSMNITLEQARESIRDIDLSPSKLDSEMAGPDIQDRVKQWAKRLASEIAHTIWSFQTKLQDVSWQDVVITGPAAGLRGMDSLLNEETGFSVRNIQNIPLALVQQSGLSDYDWPDIAVAAGLALRGAKYTQGFNFRKGRLAGSLQWNWKQPLKYTGICCGIIFLAWIVSLGLIVHFKQKKLETLHNRVDSVFKRAVPEAQVESLRPSQYASVLMNRIGAVQDTLGASVQDGQNQMTLNLLLAISKSVPDDLDLRIQNLSINAQDARITGTAASYNTVDIIKKKMESSKEIEKVQIKGVKANPDGNNVHFTLQLDRSSGPST